MTLETFDATGELARIDEAAAAIKQRLGTIPPILVIAGSGLGPIAGRLEDARDVSYGELPHFSAATVVGHAGKLVTGKLAGHPVMVMNGRKHLYEGVPVHEAIRPLRALLRGGVRTVLVSNAAGSLNRFIEPGDLMLITDHLNMQFRAPLAGPNIDAMGPRFPDASEPYALALQQVAREAAAHLRIPLREGVYLALTGPTYETRAEVEAYKQLADAVGMSTVPETLAAIHAGARVLGISAITNSHVQRQLAVTTHDEVLEVGVAIADRFCSLITEIVRRIATSPS